MRRPVYGPGSFHDSAQCASLASYEAFNSLRFLADASGRRIQGRKLDKYIIRDRDYLVFAGNPLGNKSKEKKDRFPRMDWDLFAKRLDPNKLWKRFYRISKESFSDLLALIRPELERNVAQGARSSFDGVVFPELRLSMTLRWLAGGERNRRGIQVAGRGSVGRAQPLSRNSSNHQGRLPPLSAVRVHTQPPPGWKIIPDSSVGPTHEYRLVCVQGFKLLKKKRPVVLLASDRSRRDYE